MTPVPMLSIHVLKNSPACLSYPVHDRPSNRSTNVPLSARQKKGWAWSCDGTWKPGAYPVSASVSAPTRRSARTPP